MPTLNLEVADDVTLEQVLKDIAWAARERQRLRVKDAKSRAARKAAKEARQATPAPSTTPAATPA
jgi:hypothetical protein